MMDCSLECYPADLTRPWLEWWTRLEDGEAAAVGLRGAVVRATDLTEGRVSSIARDHMV